MAPRRVHRAESAAHRRGPGRCAALAHVVGCVQALHARGMPRRLPDRLALPHRVRHGGRSGGHLQRLRLLRACMPFRRDRQAAHRKTARSARAARRRGRPGVEMHALLRPPERRPRAGLREGVSDAVDPVRSARRAARPSRRAAGEAGRRRLERCAALRARPGRRRGRLRAFFLLLDDPEVYGLPPDPVVTTKHLGAMWRNMATAAAVLAVGVAGAFIGGRS